MKNNNSQNVRTNNVTHNNVQQENIFAISLRHVACRTTIDVQWTYGRENSTKQFRMSPHANWVFRTATRETKKHHSEWTKNPREYSWNASLAYRFAIFLDSCHVCLMFNVELEPENGANIDSPWRSAGENIKSNHIGLVGSPRGPNKHLRLLFSLLLPLLLPSWQHILLLRSIRITHIFPECFLAAGTLRARRNSKTVLWHSTRVFLGI